MEKRKRKMLLCLLVAMLLLLLTACDEESGKRVKKGTERKPAGNVKNTPTTEPTGEVDPTGSVTPTPTTPVNDFTVLLSENGFLGTWIATDGSEKFITLQTASNGSDVVFYTGLLYDTAAQYEGLVNSGVVTDGKTATIKTTLGDCKLVISDNDKYWGTLIINGVSHEVRRYDELRYPISIVEYSPKQVFAEFHGWWVSKDEDGHDTFTYLIAEDGEYYMTMGYFYSEFGPAYQILGGVKNWTGDSIIVHYKDSPMYFDNPTDHWLFFNPYEPDKLRIINPNDMSVAYEYHRGSDDPSIQEVIAPSLSYVSGCSEEDAMIILKDEYLYSLESLWSDFEIAGNLNDHDISFYSPYSEKTVRILSDDHQKITQVIIQDGYAGLKIPSIDDVMDMSPEEAVKALQNFHARTIAEAWSSYIVNDQDIFVTYSKEGKTIIVKATDDYIVVQVEFK